FQAEDGIRDHSVALWKRRQNKGRPADANRNRFARRSFISVGLGELPRRSAAIGLLQDDINAISVNALTGHCCTPWPSCRFTRGIFAKRKCRFHERSKKRGGPR